MGRRGIKRDRLIISFMIRITHTNTARVVILILVLLSGCVQSIGSDDTPAGEAGDGQLNAEVVNINQSEVNSVNYTDSVVQNNKYLRRIVEKVNNKTERGEGNRTGILVPERNVDQVKESLSRFPSTNPDTVYEYNYYITYRNRTIGIQFVILQ